MANSRSITGFACLFLLCHTCCATAEDPFSGPTYQLRTEIDSTLEGVGPVIGPSSTTLSEPIQAAVVGSVPLITAEKSAIEKPAAEKSVPDSPTSPQSSPAESDSSQYDRPVSSDSEHGGLKPSVGTTSDSSVGCHPLTATENLAPQQEDTVTVKSKSFSRAGSAFQDLPSGTRLSGCYPVVNVATRILPAADNMPSSAVPPIPSEEDFRQAAMARFTSNPIGQVSFSGFQVRALQRVDFASEQTPFFGSPLETSQHPMNGLKYLSESQTYFDRNIDSEVAATDGGNQSNDVSGNYVDDLKKLVNDEPVSSADGSYLTDLSQLLGDQPAWILTHGQLVDLGPGEPQHDPAGITYLNELQSLVGDSHALADCRRTQTNFSLLQCATTPSLRRASANSRSDNDRYYEIPDVEACDEKGGDSVVGLFKPIGEIQVKGVSSAPPQPSRNAKVSSLTLVRPPNEACSYLQLDIPMHYLTSGYGVRRAPRNTYRFCNNPLYFEDPNLERCGQSRGCLTTACSMVHFTAMTSLLPYLTTADPPRSCVAALPDCRTCHSFGSDAYFPEWSWKAATVQAAAVTGLVFVIP